MTMTLGLLCLAIALGVIFVFIECCSALMGGLLDEDEE